MENTARQEKRASIKRQIIVFSIALFFVILLGGGTVFVLSMQQIVETSTGQELSRDAEVERIKLEASVNGEIALALKMATSPLLIQHFLDPAAPDIRRLAFAEIVGYQESFKSKTVFWASDTDKEFYFSEDNHYTLDIKDPDNYWYTMTLYQTEKYNFNINYNPEIQKIMLWINAPVFDTRHNPIGIVGTGIDLTEFIDSIYSDFTTDKTLYFFNAAGEITGARDTNLVTNKVTINKHLGDIGVDVSQRAKAFNSGDTVHFKMHDYEIAIDKIESLDWYIVVLQEIGLADTLSNSMTVLFVAMIAIVAAIFVIFYIFINSILKPMNYMVKALDHISADWDLTQRLQLHRNDEIGTLGKFFNITFDKMRTLLVSIKREMLALSDTGDELAVNSSTTKKDVENISKNIQVMQKNVLTQADKVNATTNSVERIIGGLNSLNDNISIQANSVAQSSSAIEEMLANIKSVTQTLIRNTENIKTLAKTSEAGRTDVQKVSTDIQEIARESEGLLEINSVMENIASQTNLLSMNAAIEAAHAGEAGKGFAVVAGEIRKLAENSTAQSKTISDVLKKIKKSIDAITKSTAIVLERFGNIESEVETVSNQENQIRYAMEEQGEGSRQILEAVTQLNSVTDMVRRSSAEMTTESNEVLQQSQSLKTITAEVADSMDQMTQGTEEIASAITRVQEISQENKENIATLSTDISKFKVE